MTRAKTAKPASKKPAARVVAKAKPAAKKPKKAAAPKKPAAKKPASKKAVAKKAGVKKPAPAKAAKKASAKPASEKASKAAPKKVAKPAVKAAAKTSAKTSAKTTEKPSPGKAAKAEKAADAKQKPAARSAAKGAAAAPAVARAGAPAADDKKRRRSRTRVTSSGPATAAWFSQGDRPRSSSFIPAPPRAEAPSLVAAPPASSDRLVGAHELTEFAVRTTPVRIDIESSGGRIYLSINPNETSLRAGEGIEWDFRYLGGADVVIEELVIEFAKPSPFNITVFRSRRPGAARPHRQLSGPAQASAAGKHLQYTVRAFNAFKTEMAVAQPAIVVA